MSATVNERDELFTLAVASLLLGARAFDTAAHVQIETKDDATLALWTSIGLETTTLASVLLKSPESAFDGHMPSACQIRDLNFRTRPFVALADEAASIYTDQPYPEDAYEFMSTIRNKLLHTGGASRAGLVAPSLRVIRGVGQWLDGVSLPTGQFRRETRVLEVERIERLPAALLEVCAVIAIDNIEHLKWSIDKGLWDDTPELKKIAVRELEECHEFV